ncbi:uncharacterized protein LOC132759989 [Ruditapes philippinarum]|uniref:uncharacterized protein LOC132759989 n=1 Tax=Ruditapes philippinarum TaxID=129788 RepID=UPI00295AF348|nr:uncharacterized protein LOC132759989 [Ruditapes philippinarum]
MYTEFIVFWLTFNSLSGLECDRGYSRTVREFVKHHLKPVYKTHNVEMPRSCPFHGERDIYHKHESHKTEEGYGKWACDYCGKMFYAEMYLDKHLSYKHSDHMYVGPDAVCLADYCDIFRCDIISGRIEPSFWDTALCIDDDMTDLILKCNRAFSTCGPADVSKNISLVILNKTKSQVCSSLTCNKYWYTGKIEPSQWRMLLKTFLTVMLIGGMIVYYFVAYHHFYTDIMFVPKPVGKFKPYVKDVHQVQRRKFRRKLVKGWT